MRILLVSETYLDLYVPILQEFKKQGHEVVFIPGDTLPSDTHRVEMNPVNRCYKRIYNYILMFTLIIGKPNLMKFQS